MATPGTDRRQTGNTAGGLTRRPIQAPRSRQTLVNLVADCTYTFNEDTDTRLSNADQKPYLSRCLRGRAALPNLPLRSASRIIAMLKCFRKMSPNNRAANAAPMIETIYTNFQRIWPQDEAKSDRASPSSGTPNDALISYDATSTLEFKILLPDDLPQSITIDQGSVYYTLQVQANLRAAGSRLEEEAVYSQELIVDIPAPESAYSTSRLPRRITNGIVGQAQDHFGILITPDISLHVSVPREINYSRHMHSVFKIHIKLMPHPPEAKLPGIAKLEWKLKQTTNLGSVQLDGEHVSKRIGISTEEIAFGQILLPVGKQQISEEAMMGSRKDQYLYIALPENSMSLLPQYYGNKYLEILHTLEVALFPSNESRPSTFTKSFLNFSKNFTKRKEARKQSWTAEIPIKITFDAAELAQIPPLQSFGNMSGNRLALAAA